MELCDGIVVLQPGAHDSIAQRVDFRGGFGSMETICVGVPGA